MAMIRPAVFLDKDGTLTPDIPYNCDPARITLAAGAGEALRELAAAGFALVVISNQSGVARGYFRESALEGVTACLRRLLGAEGVELAGAYYCTHLPNAPLLQYRRSCNCRKPLPGMLQLASAQLGIDLGGSWMVGDILDDIEAGRAAGCRTVLLESGGEREWLVTPERVPDYRATCLREVAGVIVAAGHALSRAVAS